MKKQDSSTSVFVAGEDVRGFLFHHLEYVFTYSFFVIVGNQASRCTLRSKTIFGN